MYILISTKGDGNLVRVSGFRVIRSLSYGVTGGCTVNIEVVLFVKSGDINENNKNS